MEGSRLHSVGQSCSVNDRAEVEAGGKTPGQLAGIAKQQLATAIAYGPFTPDPCLLTPLLPKKVLADLAFMEHSSRLTGENFPT